MKKITNDQLASINGGMKCIYAVVLSALFSGVFFSQSVGECFSNTHQE